MIESISAITLATHDMKRSVRFYTALGFEIVHGGETSAFTSFRAGGGYLNVVAQPKEKQWTWWGRAIFYVSDVDAMYQRALAAGLRAFDHPARRPMGRALFPFDRSRRSRAELRATVAVVNATVANSTRRAKQLTSCQAPPAKIFLFPKERIYDLTKPPRPNTRDVRPIVTTRGAGCDGRGGVQTMCAKADGKGVWSWSPDAGIKSVDDFHGRRRLTSPVLRGERAISRKPLRRECRVISAYLCWPACVFFVLHARQWVRRAPGIPCALYFLEGDVSQNPGRSCRGNAKSCHPPSLRAKRSNPDYCADAVWIASSLRSSQ